MVTFVVGGHFDGHWLGKRIDGMRHFASTVGFDPACFLSSPAAIINKLRKAQAPLDPEQWSLLDPEFTCSTIGAILIGLQAVVVGRWRAESGVDSRLRGKTMIEKFLFSFVGTSAQTVTIVSESEECAVVLEDFILTPSGNGGGMHGWFCNVLGEGLHFYDALAGACCQIRRPSKTRLNYALSFAKALLHWLEATVEAKRFDAAFDETDHLDLDPMFRTGSARPRKVSAALKEEVSREVAAWGSLRNAQQLLAATQIVRAGCRRKFGQKMMRRQRARSLQPQNGRTFCVENCMQYRAACTRLFSETKFAHVGFDGRVISTKETTLYMFEDTLQRLCCWLPPKVSSKLMSAPAFCKTPKPVLDA